MVAEQSMCKDKLEWGFSAFTLSGGLRREVFGHMFANPPAWDREGNDCLCRQSRESGTKEHAPHNGTMHTVQPHACLDTALS